jgi:hypothetical protein
MHPETFIADMKGFEQDLQDCPQLIVLHAELLALLSQLEAEVKVLIDLNRKNIK